MEAYQGIPGLRLLPGGVALLTWASISILDPRALHRWVFVVLQFVGWGGALGFAHFYHLGYGRVRRNESAWEQWKMVGVMMATAVLVTWAQVVDRRASAVSAMSLVLALTAVYFYVSSRGFCRHYLVIAAGYLLLAVVPQFGYSARELFIDPAYVGYGGLGVAMMASAILDDRVLRRMLPDVTERSFA